MSSTIRVTLPKIYAPLLEAHGKTAIEHAALDARAPEALLGLALTRTGQVAHISPAVDSLRWKMRDWCPEAKHAKLFDVSRYQVGEDLTLWLAGAANTLPVRKLDDLMVSDAHALRDDPIAVLQSRVTRDTFVAGQIGNLEEWFYIWTRTQADQVVRINADQIVEAFPDQAEYVLPRRDPRHRRLMQLRDVVPRPTPFRSFARRRLKVRTDKGRTFLSTAQQEEAAKQLGRDWHTGQVGTPLVSFELTALHKHYLAMKRLGRRRGFRRFLVLKARRFGITTVEQGISYATIAELPRSYVQTIAHTAAATRRIFRIANLFHEHDENAPAAATDSKTDIDLTNGSYFFFNTAGGRGVARGETLQRAHCSEVAFWCEGPNQHDDIDKLMSGVLGAASRGEVVLETTPNGRNWFFHTWREAQRGENEYFPIFLPWFADPANRLAPTQFSEEELRDTITQEEAELVKRHGLTLGQVAFRRAMKREHRALFAQEYPEDAETCFLTSGNCYFDVERCQELLGEVEQVPFTETHIPGGRMREWEAPQKGERYVAGVDTSEGIPGGDPNGIGILNKRTGAQVMCIHGLFPPRQLASIAVKACKRYNRAMLGIERNNHGHAVLERVRDLKYFKPHYRGGPLYHFSQAKVKLTQREARGAKAGWDTNSRTREIMLADLSEALLDGGLGVRDRLFVQECLSFRMQTNGKYSADSGEHDDRVMKWAIAWQMRRIRTRRPGIRSIAQP